MRVRKQVRLAYLVRLWQVHSEGRTVWRGSLEDAHSGERQGFADPAGLFAFLRDKLGCKPETPGENGPTGKND